MSNMLSSYERTKNLSIIFFVSGGLFLLLTVIFFNSSSFKEVFYYNFTNDLRGSFFTLFSFIISIVSFLLGIVLRRIAKEGEEEIILIEARIKREILIEINKQMKG
ncbi:hypothetical protein [Cohnella abietis]|uniref:Two-component sensor histidine kinase n=1 Tax=Cohnella abietis TaxID=2507935 RepID=A0A3T1D645_9BACL|nr:hypothetical protein [Cohnella abietis]BBI33548.1 hypothetical protein KCTCHS21_29470 [Cohnella abietis]